MRPLCRLYLISPPTIDLDAFKRQLGDALADGAAAAFQLRLKADDDVILRTGAALAPIVQAAGAAFILNDRPDLADKLGADGVHIGQEDAPYAQARAIMGADRIVGVTCHASRHLAMEAGEAGADYVAFGAFYPSATKTPPAFAEPEILTWWQDLMEIPCVAIGGVTLENAAPLVEAGADFLAVGQGVWGHPQGPSAAVKGFTALFARLV